VSTQHIILTINDNAIGQTRPGTKLEYVRPGQNQMHVIVRNPGQRRTWGIPSAWVDGLEATP